MAKRHKNIHEPDQMCRVRLGWVNVMCDKPAERFQDLFETLQDMFKGWKLEYLVNQSKWAPQKSIWFWILPTEASPPRSTEPPVLDIENLNHFLHNNHAISRKISREIGLPLTVNHKTNRKQYNPQLGMLAVAYCSLKYGGAIFTCKPNAQNKKVYKDLLHSDSFQNVTIIPLSKSANDDNEAIRQALYHNSAVISRDKFRNQGSFPKVNTKAFHFHYELVDPDLKLATFEFALPEERVYVAKNKKSQARQATPSKQTSPSKANKHNRMPKQKPESRTTPPVHDPSEEKLESLPPLIEHTAQLQQVEHAMTGLNLGPLPAGAGSSPNTAGAVPNVVVVPSAVVAPNVSASPNTSLSGANGVGFLYDATLMKLEQDRVNLQAQIDHLLFQNQQLIEQNAQLLHQNGLLTEQNTQLLRSSK